MAKKKISTILIQSVRSEIGFPEKQRKVLRGLGLRKLQQIVERQDTPSIRGMVKKIPHLVVIVPAAKGGKA